MQRVNLGNLDKKRFDSDYGLATGIETKWDDFGNADPLESYPNYEYCVKQTRELLNTLAL
jgi:hypothetical protein